MGAELATPLGRKVKWSVAEKDIKDLEARIDRWDDMLEELRNFILPSGHPASTAFHLARTIVRCAERCVVAVENVNPIVMAYLN